MSDVTAIASSAYRQILEVIGSVEPRIAAATKQELTDQRGSLKLIASENYASLPVLLTMGTWLSDKYAEGTIGHRFYAGCQNIDTVESVAAEHARELFGAEYAYVQPHSGIDANLVAYWAILSHRIESPTPERLGAKTVNDPAEADWEARARAGGVRDPASENLLRGNVIEYRRQCAVYWGLKRVDLAERFGHVLMMERGRLVERGKFADLKSSGGALNKLLAA